eukprot:TRINITY_DN23548_c0_g1_i1.p1 TRINITY_DN23548_c0_g1~~TRINITY_DN23548_c0_g1_i1.p1  ORF type:complete len:322 (-),score=81.68 TRINITY_DN23548_c0_g1_i1:14-919(-)
MILSAAKNFLNWIYLNVIWRVVKFTLRKLTGKSELQRICEKCLVDDRCDPNTTLQILDSLRRSRRLRSLVKSKLDSPALIPSQFFAEIVATKKIASSVPAFLKFQHVMEQSLLAHQQWWALQVQLEERRKQVYQPDQHVALLRRLWLVLQGDGQKAQLEVDVLSVDWTQVGFQGANPATDFRGMGVLGLEALVYFAENHPRNREILTESNTKQNWFSFAITHLNISYDVMLLLRQTDPATRKYFLQHGPTFATFFQYSGDLFAKFHDLWKAENPPNVMSFQDIHNKFLRSVTPLPIHQFMS